MNAGNWASGAVLLLGARGMLGRELERALGSRMEGTTRSKLLCMDLEEVDLRDHEKVSAILTKEAPAVVINAAAYTDVDGCETHHELAEAVNAVAPAHLARACGERGVKLVHFGTDFIFDGTNQAPYRAEDPVNPLSTYGRTKWEGEEGIRAAHCDHLIVRTSWLFGVHGRNFVEAILGQAEAGNALTVVNDQVGRPTLAEDLADAVVRLLDVGADGTIHFANTGPCSWFQFAEEILRQAGLEAPIRPITSDELARPAQRPANSVLETGRFEELTGLVPRCWQDALHCYLGQRAAGRGSTAAGTPAESAGA